MKSYKKHIFCAMTLVIAGLLIAVSASTAMQLKTLNENPTESVNIKKTAHLFKERNAHDIKLSKTKVESRNAPLENNAIIITDYDCQDPSIATDGGNILVIAEEVQEIFETDIVMIYSKDSGNTWSDIFTFPWEGTIEELPVVDYCGNSDFEAYGSCLPDYEEGRFHLLHFPSMTDEEKVWEDSEGWVEWGFDITGNYEGFEDIDVAGYPFGNNAPTPDFHGIILTSCLDSESGLETITIMFETDDLGISTLYMMDVNGTIGQISCDIDLSTGYYFEAIEWADEEGYIDDGVVFDCCWLEPGNENWWQGNWVGFTLEDAHNPDVVAESGYCYCVCEFGNGIRCTYTDDNCQTIQNSTVAEYGKNPSVAATGESVIVTYYDEGNLYKTISEDNGETWEEPIMVNDESGSCSDRTHALDAKSQFVVWTDERDGYTEIFFDKTFASGSPPSAPDINGPTNGGSEETITFSFNSDDPDNDDVRYIINWGDGNTDTTTFASSGTDKTATHSWVGDDTVFTIRARAEDENGLFSPENTFDITIPRYRAHFTELFDILPNLFRILNFLFG